MIPRRIALTGFLCYRDEQVIDLDGSDLWVFAGRNGCGKSAVFDAITYALFDCHRAGNRQNARALINDESDALRVEFDFELDGRLYRVRRTLRRSGRAERQVFARDARPGAPTPWPAVEGTESDAGFRAWVARHVGLTFETFTASTLLLQGKAERLLATQPKERFEVLQGVVGLERFRRLAERADAIRRERALAAKHLRGQLAAAPPIAVEDLAAAAALVDAAGTAREAAEAAVRRAEDLRRQADDWATLESESADATRRLADAESLLEDAPTIARDHERLRELDAALPRVREAAEARDALRAIAEAERARDRDRAEIGSELCLVAATADRLAADHDALRSAIEEAEALRLTIADRLGALSGPIARARLAADRRDACERLEREAAAFGPDLAERLSAAEVACDEAIDAGRTLPILGSFAEHRDAASVALIGLDAARLAVDAAAARLGHLAGDRDAAASEVEAARSTLQTARDGATEAATLASESAARLDRLEGLEGSPTCDRCGQPLDAAHIRDERDRLIADCDARARRLAVAEADRAAAESALSRAETTLVDRTKVLREVETQHRLAIDRLRDAERTIELHRTLRDQAVGSLPDALRDRTSDGYPTADDLDGLRTLAATADDRTRRRDQLRDEHDRARAVAIRLEQARRDLESLGDASDLDALLAEDAGLRESEGDVTRALLLRRAQASLTDAAARLVASRRGGLDRRRGDLERCSEADRARSDLYGEARRRAIASLPVPWRERVEVVTTDDVDAWERERDALRSAGVEARAAALPLAADRREAARRDLGRIEGRRALIAPEARVDPGRLDRELAAARATLIAADRDLRSRQADHDRLRGEADRRRGLQAQSLEADRALAVAESLAGLLGREGLQRDLLREAERGIVACAGPILQEISGGELALRLAGGAEVGPEHALDLVAIERIGGRTKAVPVANLSGSQRFRVAVSLALGIGQYARGRHRTIESVIIDEGFGGLDRDSRREMIGKLNDLRGRLARIVLVSHQEEFFDAFSDGYAFERSEETGGATVVTPFHL